MKRFLILTFIILITTICSAEIDIVQDELNREYLLLLDQSITGTIEVLSAYNEMLMNVPDLVTGKNPFANLLMDYTLDCSSIRNEIADSEDLSAPEREILIRLLINMINQEVKWIPVDIGFEKDQENREIARIMGIRFKKHIIDLQKEILLEEAGIVESGTFHKYFFNLHSQHFMYLLMMDFLEPSGKLSRENRDFLLKMVRYIEAEMMSKKKQ